MNDGSEANKVRHVAGGRYTYRVIISDAPGVQYIHRVMRSDAVSQKATARSIDESVKAKLGARLTCKSTYI